MSLLINPYRFSGVDYQATILADSPVAYWRLNESSGATTIVDETGSYDGTPSGGVTLGVTGARGAAATFDGVDGYISTSALGSLGGSATLTVEFWLKWTSTTARMVALGTQDSGSNQALKIIVNGSTGTGTTARTGGICFTRRTTVGRWRDTSRSNLNDGAWHHYVATFASDSSYPDIYIDGSLDNGTTGGYASTTVGNWDNPLLIGANNEFGTPATFYAGDVDEVALYSTVLNSTQVSTHYNASP